MDLNAPNVQSSFIRWKEFRGNPKCWLSEVSSGTLPPVLGRDLQEGVGLARLSSE